MKFEKIAERNREWVKSKNSINPGYFKKQSEGQSPEILYIGCSDSRVPPEQIMGLEQGDMFVHRNVANLVPPGDKSSEAVIYFAVTVLKVKHIIVCGHYGCGGIHAASGSQDLGKLDDWLGDTRRLVQCHAPKLESLSDFDKHKELVEITVGKQCENVKKIPEVSEAVKAGNLTVHGMVYDIETGLLKLID